MIDSLTLMCLFALLTFLSMLSKMGDLVKEDSCACRNEVSKAMLSGAKLGNAQTSTITPLARL